MQRDPKPKSIPDLVNIATLNDAELLRVVRMRFDNADIYTWVGPTMLVVNPFYRIEKLENDGNFQIY